jgi:hypothetical protein
VRHAHGVFGRYTPAKPLVLLAEADLLAQAAQGGSTSSGFVAMLQADAEVTQGLHLIATTEALKLPDAYGTSAELWGSVVWFFLPHFDTRLDLIWQSAPTRTSTVETTTLLAQIHAFL